MAALLLCSCSDKEAMQQTTMEIAVSPTIAEASRSIPITSISGVDQLDVNVYRHDTGGFYFKDLAAAVSGRTEFVFSKTHYWLPGIPLDFYAYTPSPCVDNVVIENGTIKFDYDQDKHSSTSQYDADILTGSSEGVLYEDTNNGVVPMKLDHALCLVEFAVAYDEENGFKTSKIGKDVVITELRLRNVSLQGRCTVDGDQCNWDVSTPTEWVIADFTEGGTKEGLRVGTDISAGDFINTPDRKHTFIVVPDQILSEMQVSFIEGAPFTYTTNFSTTPIKLKAGKHYVLNLSIKSNEVTVTDTSVRSWIQDSNIYVTM